LPIFFLINVSFSITEESY